MAKNILIVGPKENGRLIGGIDSCLNFYLKNAEIFKSKGFNIKFINANQIVRRFRNSGRLEFENILNSVKLCKRILREINENETDVIQFHSSARLSLLRDQVIILFISLYNRWVKRRKINFLLNIHSNIGVCLGKGLTYYANKFLLYNIQHYPVLLSEDNFSYLENYRKPKYYIHNISFMNERYLLVDKTCKGDQLKMIFIGSLSKEKGLLDLLTSLLFINPSKYSLTIIGEFTNQKAEEEIKKFLKTYPYLSVFFKGKIVGKEKYNALKESHLMVLPSYNEGMPISVLEAMCLGNAIVTTRVGCIPDLIEDYAVLVQAGNVDELRIEINNFIYSLEYLKKYQLKAMEFSKINNNISSYIENVCSLFLKAS
jgi:glycosyltransferase involved in cell wall biosynthesis